MRLKALNLMECSCLPYLHVEPLLLVNAAHTPAFVVSNTKSAFSSRNKVLILKDASNNISYTYVAHHEGVMTLVDRLVISDTAALERLVVVISGTRTPW
jgi:hypothetical protein